MQVTFTLNVGLTSVLMRAHRCVQYLNNVRALYKKECRQNISKNYIQP